MHQLGPHLRTLSSIGHPPCIARRAGPAHPLAMESKSRETICGIDPGSGRAGDGSAQGSRPAGPARRGTSECSAFGPAQPSPAWGDAINAGFGYLEVKCLGCSTHQTVALDIVRRPKTTPVHELERYMRCKDCSQVRF